jgi:hypothetical protein
LKRLIATLLSALAMVLPASLAHAQAAADFPAIGTLSDVTSGVEQTRPFWGGSGPSRGFMAAAFSLGVVNFEPRLQLGYGKPHHQWIGVEGGPTMALGGTRFYGGLRAKSPGIDFRVGTRFETQFSSYLLPVQHKYVREDLELEGPEASRYLATEAELIGAIPFPGGNLFAVLTGMAITNVPDNRNVWERSLRTVIAPPWVWRARLGYLGHIGWAGSMKLGAAAEVIHVPLRDMVVVRAGPLVSVGLTHHLEVSGGLMIVAASRDDIGLPAADVGNLALVYKWATGDRWSEFP